MSGEKDLTEQARRRRDVAMAGHRANEAAARGALTDLVPAVRATALGALARIGKLRDDDLRAALTEDDAGLRRRACELAAKHPDVDIVPLLSDPDRSVVEAAAWALGEQGHDDARAVDALTTVALQHRNKLCREAAVAALGAIGSPKALPAILAAMQDKPTVRRRAVLALAPFEGPEVDAALRTALTDNDWQVRQAAEDLLE
jgi:HEAT repeat protein